MTTFIGQHSETLNHGNIVYNTYACTNQIIRAFLNDPTVSAETRRERQNILTHLQTIKIGTEVLTEEEANLLLFNFIQAQPNKKNIQLSDLITQITLVPLPQDRLNKIIIPMQTRASDEPLELNVFDPETQEIMPYND